MRCMTLALLAALFLTPMHRTLEARQTKGKSAKAKPAAVRHPRPADAERAHLLSVAASIRKTLAAIPGVDDLSFADQLRHADVEIYAKAIEWMLRHDEFYQRDFLDMLREVAVRGQERARQLATGKHPWTSASGRVARAYPSPIDGSVQPYVVVVPENYDRAPRPFKRLDVVLHGRNGNLNEVWFLAKNDGKPAPAGLKNLELHVNGRGNNAFRWAGEQDVHDAIEVVVQEYGIDRRFIVLKGFSMGGAGAWHLGLHHPTKWMSVEAGAGFTDTLSKIKLGPLPQHQLEALKHYDAVECAANTANVPVVCYGGEDDPQLLAPKLIQQRLVQSGWKFTTEGLVTRATLFPFMFVVGEKMGHRVDPKSRHLMDQFHDDIEQKAQRRLADVPVDVWPPLDSKSFVGVAMTCKFGDVVPGVRLHRLERLYAPATVWARYVADQLHLDTTNLLEIEVRHPAVRRVAIDGKHIDLPPCPPNSVHGQQDGWLMRGSHGWQFGQRPTQLPGEPLAKRRNSQGPIDDAFTRPFLCIRGVGTPWNRAVHEWAMRRLDRFAAEWDKNLRGQLRIKTDAEYKPRDARVYNLVLFGDPGSNRVMASLLGKLPLRWTKERLEFAGDRTAVDHIPTFIFPNPENPVNYVVFNSGHTFGQADFEGTNALLFPRLGDYAVLQISRSRERVVTAGFFDKDWRIPND